MGLGKTLQAISVACVFREEWPLLIIVPSSLKFSWIEELEKWIPDILPNHINLVHSGADASGISNTPISIISYGLLRMPSSIVVRTAITARKFKVIICDESHYLKNPKSLSTKVIVPIIKSAKRKILLSGTPALAKPVELYSQIDAVCPGKFGSFWQFTDRYCNAHMVFYGKGRRHRNVDGASNLEELQKKMHSLLMIRREKSEVLTELPPKQRQRVMFDLKESAQKKEIVHRFGQLRENITKGNTFFQLLMDKESSNDGSLDSGQSQSEEQIHEERVGNDGMDVNDSEDTSVFREISTLYRLSGEAKIGPVRDYIDMLCENDSLKFLVFAYHHAMMDGIQQTLHDKNLKFVRIDGHTKGLERQACVSTFQSDSSVRVAILSILAAGVGLTLTAAKLVVFAELYWTPGVMIQCEDRAHRIGQVDSLPIHYLVAKNTMDEWVWSAVCRKTCVTSTALTGKSKKLEHEEGDTHHIDVLSNADMWKASKDREHVDVSELIKSQRAPDQPSILDFLSPSQKNVNNADSLMTKNLGKKKTKQFTTIYSVAGCASRLSEGSDRVNRLDTHLEEVIVLDSDDEEIFKPPSKKRKRLKDNQHQRKAVNKELKSQKTVESDIKKKNKFTEIDDDFVSEPVLKTPKGNKTKGDQLGSFDDDFMSRDRGEMLSRCTDRSTIKPLYTLCKDKNKGISENGGTPCDDSSSSDNLTKSDCHVSEQDTASLKNKVQWSCCLCTFMNHADLPFCEMCDSPKRKGPKTMRDENAVQARSHTRKSLVIEESNREENSNCDLSTELIPDSIEINSLINEPPAVAVEENNHDEKGENQSIQSDNHRLKHMQCGTLNPENQKQPCCSMDGKQFGNDFEPSDISKTALVEAIPKPASHVHSKDDQPLMKSSTPSPLSNRAEENAIEPTPKISQHKCFRFSCSMHTGRVFVYNEQGVSLQASFIPIDIEMGNIADLPYFLKQPHHLKLIQRFVREWSSLANTKKKLIAKRGLVFEHPLLAIEEVKSVHGNTQRHMTKNDLKTAMEKAKVKRGSVRFISHPNQSSGEEASSSTTSSGVNQILDPEGIPLCLQCGKPYSNSLLPKNMISASKNAWLMRLCSYPCMDKYWTLNHASYCRDQIYDIERGICQLCQFGAHDFYAKMRVIKDVKKRAEVLMKSPYHKLASSLREKMVLHPVPGQFWHVDHIIPVWQGGGMCDVDNLRTLCTPCHTKVTSRQAGQRAVSRKLSSAASSGDIAAFFQR